MQEIQNIKKITDNFLKEADEFIEKQQIKNDIKFDEHKENQLLKTKPLKCGGEKYMKNSKEQKIKVKFYYVADSVDDELEELIENVIISGRSYVSGKDKFVGSGFDLKKQLRDIEYELDKEDLEHMYHRFDLYNN